MNKCKYRKIILNTVLSAGWLSSNCLASDIDNSKDVSSTVSCENKQVIYTVDSARLAQELKACRTSIQKFISVLEQQQSQIRACQQELEQLSTRIDRDAEVLRSEELEKAKARQAKLVQKLTVMKQEISQENMAQKQQTILRTQEALIQSAIKAYAEEEGNCHVLFDASSIRYAPEGTVIDVTEAVLHKDFLLQLEDSSNEEHSEEKVETTQKA